MDETIARQMSALLIDPREDLHIEIKSWLDLSDKAGCSILARAALGLANHGGGFLIIGLREGPLGFTLAPDAPANLSAYSQDAIARIVTTYAEPPFQVAVRHVEGPLGVFPIVQVPGGHRTPILAKKGSPDAKTLIGGRTYIRRPLPETAEPQSAGEWRELIDRCVRAGRDDLLDAIRGILDGAALSRDEPAPSDADRLDCWIEDGLDRWRTLARRTPTGAAVFPPGHYVVAYRLSPEPEPMPTPQLLEAIGRATARLTGWSPWWVPTRDGIRPYLKDDAIECFLGADHGGLDADPAHSDFWRISPAGQALLVKGFDEDSIPEKIAPGTAFDLVLPVWRIGECLMQAANFADQVGVPEATVQFQVRWSGLSGRTLKVITGSRWIHEGRVARQDELVRRITIPAQEIADRLPEILQQLLSPLYALFDFMELPKSMVDEEVQRLRSRG